MLTLVLALVSKKRMRCSLAIWDKIATLCKLKQFSFERKCLLDTHLAYSLEGRERKKMIGMERVKARQVR